VPLQRSTHRLNIRGREAVVPYSGSVWVDPDTQDVVRIETRAKPSDLSVTSITESTDYRRLRIGQEEFQLPLSSQLFIVELDGTEHHNVSQFSNCRQYSAASSVSFDVRPVALSSSEDKRQDLLLPAGAVLDLKLQTLITFEESAVGDLFTARLDRTAKAGGIQLPKGATITGRIRRLERHNQAEKFFFVGLQLLTAAFEERSFRLNSRLVGPHLVVREVKETQFHREAPTSKGFESKGLDIDGSDPSRDYGAFRIWSNRLRLPRGFQMTWETVGEQSKPVLTAAAPELVPPPRPIPQADAQPVRRERESVIRVTARTVEVHVVAQDRKGQPALNLAREDFVLLDRGQPQAITGFSIEGGAPVSPDPRAMTNSGECSSNSPRRATVILFDRLNTRSESQNHARSEILKALKKIGSRERIALYVLDSRLHVLADFTGDTGAIARALAEVGGRTSGELSASEPPKPERQTDRFQWLEREMTRMDRSIADLATQARAEMTLRALEAIGRHLSRVPGRKTLLWVSDAFPLAMGFDANDVLTRSAQPEERSAPAPTALNLSAELSQTARVLTDANVALYPVEARGLTGVPAADAAVADSNFRLDQPRPSNTGSLPPPLASPQKKGNLEAITEESSVAVSVHRTRNAMQVLAAGTGGRAFIGSNDLGGNIHRALEDAKVVYVLSYQPTHKQWDGKFRPLEVRVNRPGVSALYRRGYFASAGKEEPRK